MYCVHLCSGGLYTYEVRTTCVHESNKVIKKYRVLVNEEITIKQNM